MIPRASGRQSYCTRVERWECDYNDHWNVRFYGRSFQAAAEAVAYHASGQNPGTEVAASRLMRFHSELRVSAPVEVRTSQLIAPGPLNGATVHALWSGDTLAATALDLPGKAADLPDLSVTEAAMALPKGIVDAPPAFPAMGADVTEVALGPVRPEELDHTGHLRFDTILRHSSNIQHIQLNKLGLTPEFAAQHRINRMGVEFRVTPMARPEVTAPLMGRTWVWKIAGKAFWAVTQILATGTDKRMIAQIEMCVVTVNLDTRKAVAVPEFMYAALGGN